MSNDLAILEAEFKPRLPAFADVLAPYRIPAAAFQTGVLALFEQNPWLLSCKPQSIINACMSVAVQGLRLDPASQQSCIVPFSGKAQAITMVKGYTVIAARAGYTLQAWTVREGDRFKERAGGELHLHDVFHGKSAKMLGTYAVARSKAMPLLVTPLVTIDEIIATRDHSKGYQKAKADGKSHPWMTDFDAMALKTAKRLLAKDIPNDMLQMAAWLELQHDLGNVAYLRPDGQGVVDTTAEVYPERSAIEGAPVNLDPPFAWTLSNGEVKRWHDAHSAEDFIVAGAARATAEQAKQALDRNETGLAGWPDQAAAARVREALTKRVAA